MALHHMLRAAAGNAGPSDPYFEYNALLLTGDGTNGAQNNTFLDSSSNNFTITRNGNTTQGTFSPYGNLWSNYFDGSGDYLTVPPSSALSFGTGDFTVEFWMISTVYARDPYDRRIFRCLADPMAGTGNGWEISLNGNPSGGIGQLMFSTPSSGTILTTTSTVCDGTWKHIAVTRSGTTFRLFVNGVVAATNTANPTITDPATYNTYISWFGGTGAAYFNGNLSNVRIVKGTALYTSNFTPSTTPLTAVSGTSLLTCQSNRFIDNSSNNFTLTVNGNTSVQRFSPFNPTAPYSASTIGGSGYFDGNGDNLSIPANAALVLTGDFTLEAYIYRTSATNGMLFGSQNGASSDYVFITNNAVDLAIAAGGPVYPSFAVTMPVYAWTHIAVTRQSGVIKVFVNGVQAGSNATITATMFQSVPFLIGRYGYDSNPYWFNGYISNVRIVKGTALYTSNFTPSTTPLTAVSNTSLLLNFTNAGISDAAMQNDLETVGNAQVSTSVKKYGTGSLAFDGTGDWLQTSNVLGWSFGSGNFTVECWFNSTSTNQYASLVSADNTGTSGGWSFLLNPTANDGKITFYEQNLAGSLLTTSTGGYNDGSWHHVALVRNGTSLVIYVDGTSRASSTTSATASVPGSLYVGNSSVSGRALTGYIDDLRITKGYARYTSNFTPPTAALPVY